MIVLHVGPIWTRVEYQDESTQAVQEMVDILSWPVPGARFSKAFKYHGWDGTRKLYNLRHHAFPSGLVTVVGRSLTARGSSVREAPVEEPPRTFQGPLPAFPGVPWTPAQVAALEALRTHARGIVQMTVATGKGELIAALLRMYPGPAVVLVNAADLRTDLAERYTERLGRAPGYVGGGVFDPREITIGLYQTLRARQDRPEVRAWLERIQLLIVDEVDLASAKGFAEVLRLIPAPRRYGFSATAFEKDPSDRPKTIRDAELVGSIGEMLYEHRQYPVRVHVQVAELWAPVHAQAPYEAAYLASVLDNPQGRAFLCKWVRGRVARGQHGLVLVGRRVHGRAIAADLGVDFISGEDSSSERDLLRYDFNARRVPAAVVGQKILGRGINLPAMDWIVLADPGKDAGNVIQFIGRVARARADKTDAWVLDLQVVGHRQLESHAKQRNRTYKREGFSIEVMGRWGQPYVWGQGSEISPPR